MPHVLPEEKCQVPFGLRVENRRSVTLLREITKLPVIIGGREREQKHWAATGRYLKLMLVDMM